MTEVIFGPGKPSTTDWRWQEVLSMEPLSVMAELRELDVNLFAARSELREAVRELAELEDVLDKATQQALEGIRDGADQDLRDRLFKGGTKDERAQRQVTYLGTFDWVKQSWAEIKAASTRKDNAQVAFDSLLDRQTNLGRFANMYAATARLLVSIRSPEELVEAMLPSAPFEATLYFVAAGKTSLCVPCLGSEDIVTAQRMAKEQGYQEVSAAVYELVSRVQGGQLAEWAHMLAKAYRESVSEDEVMDATSAAGPSDNVWPIFQFAERAKEEIMPPSLHDLCADVRSWMEWHKNPMGSPPVDTAELVDRVVVAGVEELKSVAAAIVKTVKTAAERDEIEIPASMELLPDEAEAAAAAIERHRGEESDEDLPFQPDEPISL